jgi:hypothetical protein
LPRRSKANLRSQTARGAQAVIHSTDAASPICAFEGRSARPPGYGPLPLRLRRRLCDLPELAARLGLWQESIEANRAASNVDDLFWKFLAMRFLLYSYLQTGQDHAAEEVLDELVAIENVNVHHVNIAYVLA